MKDDVEREAAEAYFKRNFVTILMSALLQVQLEIEKENQKQKQSTD